LLIIVPLLSYDEPNVSLIQTPRSVQLSLTGHTWDKLLDIGCGALCGGYWMINFLRPGCYFGVEPNTFMFEEGVKHLVNGH